MKRSLFISLLGLISTHSAFADVGDVVDITKFSAEGVNDEISTFMPSGYVYATSTRFYDSAKLTYNSGADDSLMCWAHSASNALQYWQTYYGVFATNSIPFGTYATSNKWADKVTDLKIASEMRSYFKNTSGTFELASEWYMKGEAPTEKLKTLGGGGYYENYFGATNSYIKQTVQSTDLNTLTTAILNAFGIAKEGNSFIQAEAGLIPFLDIAYTRSDGLESGHTLSCYAFKTNSQGEIDTLYLADPDSTDGTPLTIAYIGISQTTGELTLYSDTNKQTPLALDSNGNTWFIRTISYINTPEVLKNMLAEYSDVENEAQIWNGGDSTWESQEENTNELPTEATGWDVLVDGDAITGEENKGYYHTYSTDGRAVEFGEKGAANKSITINGTVKTSHITVSAAGYEFKAGDDAAIAGAGDNGRASLSITAGASLNSAVALRLDHLSLESGASLSSTQTIEVHGEFTVSLKAMQEAVTYNLRAATLGASNNTNSASVNAALNLSTATSVLLGTSVDMQENALTFANKQTITLDYSSSDAEILLFDNISTLTIGEKEYSAADSASTPIDVTDYLVLQYKERRLMADYTLTFR